MEGGAVIAKDSDVDQRVFLSKAFGHKGDDHFRIGINGKNSEFHAAMGLCNLPRVNESIKRRKMVFDVYEYFLNRLPIIWRKPDAQLTYNYAYFPILLDNYDTMIGLKNHLESFGIFPRRYFYPALNTLPYFKGESCPVAENVAQRLLCLPLYPDLEIEDASYIGTSIRNYFE